MLPKKTHGASGPPSSSCYNQCYEKKHMGASRPPLFLLLQPVLRKKTHGDITPPSLPTTTKFFHKRKSQKNIMPLPLPPIVIITVTKNTHKVQGYICMLKIEGERDTTFPCNCCEPKTQGEHDAPTSFLLLLALQ